MYGMGISIVIPSRNEPYLQKTIQSLISSTSGLFEILVILDGYWCEPQEIVDDPRVIYVHFARPRGMRNAINTGVALAKYDYILKTDAHCLFEKGFDTKLIEHHKDNWVQVPRRYALDVEKWTIEDRDDNKYPIDRMILDENFKGTPTKYRNKEPIEEIQTAQGSCWFMKKSYYEYLELLDDHTYGTFWQEFQEISFKAWLSGGKVVRNSSTWFAHQHKTEGRGYNLREDNTKAQEALMKWKTEKMFSKQIHNFNWFINKFKYEKN